MNTNNHSKYVEVNAQHNTIRIVEKDRFGRIYGESKLVKFNSHIDAMKLSLTMNGYSFHHASASGLITVYKEV